MKNMENMEKGKKHFRLNIHIVLIAVFILCITIIFIKFKNWGVTVDHDDIFGNADDDIHSDNYDSFHPLRAAENDITPPPLKTSDGLNIVLFGNNPFSDDRNSGDGLANMIAAMAGEKIGNTGIDVTVYNCSIGGSYMAAEQPHFTTEQPWDAFSLYWMSLITTDILSDDYYGAAMDALGADAPAELAEVRKTITEIDFDKVDVIAIMYDGTDYLMGHPISDASDYADIQQFIPHLEAALDIFLENHPDIRIIVLSPPYAFSDQLDENGDYISSDIYPYGEDDKHLSRYAITESYLCAEKEVTFIDNIYGTFNEDEAKYYLTDNLHLNVEGRRKIAERFISALFYYGTD